MTREAIYAGSFDPWSFGHAFVLDSALGIFDVVHICVAVNPAKTGILTPEKRSYLIAKSIAPFHYFSAEVGSYQIHESVTVDFTYGLVSDFAKKRGIQTLLRGLRSTSDFEAEFNLYFSNYAISPEIKTWTVMCPPELLHCSSTYVRTVVGRPSVSTVGTCFLSQCMLLNKPTIIGEIFDIVVFLENHRPKGKFLQGISPINRILQVAFSSILENVSTEQLAQLEAGIRPIFQDSLREAQAKCPQPLTMTRDEKATVFSCLQPVIARYLKSLIAIDIPESSAQTLEVIRLANNRDECYRGLSDLWSSYDS